MKRLTMMLLATSLLIGAAPMAGAEPTQNDKLEAAKAAELKGDLARVHKDNELAFASYSAALRLSSKNAQLNNKLGIVELQTHRSKQASKHFALAHKYDPQLIYPLNNLGAVLLLQKKYKPALDYFKQALALDESSAPTHINLAESWMGLGETEHAMTEYARALELDADVLSSDKEGVIAQVMTPQQRACIDYLLAKAYVKRGNLDGALDYLQRAKDLRFADLSKVYIDSDFTPLWKDPRLAKIIKRS